MSHVKLHLPLSSLFTMGQGLDAPGGRRVASDGMGWCKYEMQFQLLQGEGRMGDGEEREERREGGRCALPGNSPLIGFTATLCNSRRGQGFFLSWLL